MSPSEVEIDLRKYPRVNEDCDVSFSLVEESDSPKGQSGEATNISGGGMSFSTAEPLTEGAMIALRVDLPKLPNTVVALAKVVWSRRNEETGRYDQGVEFWWIGWSDSHAQNSMLDYVNGKLEQE